MPSQTGVVWFPTRSCSFFPFFRRLFFLYGSVLSHLSEKVSKIPFVLPPFPVLLVSPQTPSSWSFVLRNFSPTTALASAFFSPHPVAFFLRHPPFRIFVVVPLSRDVLFFSPPLYRFFFLLFFFSPSPILSFSLCACFFVWGSRFHLSLLR